MPRPLERDVAALSSQTFDVCVIGGGITGLCIAHDAATRGLTVALLERGDFAEGTSSASTKLIHGGTRYLEHYEFGLVREALRERRLLMRLAPHQMRPLPFLFPLYKGGPVPPWMLRAGMTVYDALAWDRNQDTLADKRFPWHTFIGPKLVLEREPALQPEGLLGAVVYADGQAPTPMRRCIALARTAASNGARRANYAQVGALGGGQGRREKAEVLDRLTGKTFAVKAKSFVNCAGIWATDVMALLGKPLPLQLKPSKGIHLVTRALGRSHALIHMGKDDLRLMVIPWRGKSLIGLTDDFYEGDLERIRANVQEAQRLLDGVNQLVPEARVTLEDVEHSYAGVRPLVYRPGKSASDLSRRYQLGDHAKASGVAGMSSILGGKLTTSRSLAETVVDRLAGMVGQSGRSATASLPIGGGDIGVVEEYLTRVAEPSRGLVDEECLRELIASYGSDHVAVLDYVRKDSRLGRRIAPDRPFVLAQVHHAVEQEMATCVADVAFRRTDAGNLGDRSGEIGRAIADELTGLLSLTPEQKSRQLTDYLDHLAMDGVAPSAAATASQGSAS